MPCIHSGSSKQLIRLRYLAPESGCLKPYNGMDYEARPSKELSSTFANQVQDRLIVNALEWLGTGKKPQSPGGNQPGK